MNTAVTLAGEGGANSIDHTHAKCTTLETVAHGEDRIGGLARLRNEDADIITEDRGLSVEEIRGKLDGDRNFRQFFEDGTGLSRNGLS